MIEVRLEIFIGIKRMNLVKQIDVQNDLLLRWRIYKKVDLKNPPFGGFFYFESFLIISFCHQIVKMFPNKLATVIGPTQPGTGLIA